MSLYYNIEAIDIDGEAFLGEPIRVEQHEKAASYAETLLSRDFVQSVTITKMMEENHVPVSQKIKVK